MVCICKYSVSAKFVLYRECWRFQEREFAWRFLIDKAYVMRCSSDRLLR